MVEKRREEILILIVIAHLVIPPLENWEEDGDWPAMVE